VIALVDLEEGPRVVSNLVECDAAAIVAGMALELVWQERPGPPTVLPTFRPAPRTTQPDSSRRQT
jgi:uncharacterized OB-fold protein